MIGARVLQRARLAAPWRYSAREDWTRGTRPRLRLPRAASGPAPWYQPHTARTPRAGPAGGLQRVSRERSQAVAGRRDACAAAPRAGRSAASQAWDILPGANAGGAAALRAKVFEQLAARFAPRQSAPGEEGAGALGWSVAAQPETEKDAGNDRGGRSAKVFVRKTAAIDGEVRESRVRVAPEAPAAAPADAAAAAAVVERRMRAVSRLYSRAPAEELAAMRRAALPRRVTPGPPRGRSVWAPGVPMQFSQRLGMYVPAPASARPRPAAPPARARGAAGQILHPSAGAEGAAEAWEGRGGEGGGAGEEGVLAAVEATVASQVAEMHLSLDGAADQARSVAARAVRQVEELTGEWTREVRRSRPRAAPAQPPSRRCRRGRCTLGGARARVRGGAAAAPRRPRPRPDARRRPRAPPCAPAPALGAARARPPRRQVAFFAPRRPCRLAARARAPGGGS